MKILLRLPNWLGDAVMMTPTFELLKNNFPKASFTLVGTQATCLLFERDYRIDSFFVDNTKKSKNRILATYQLAKKIGKHDIAITFTNNFFSAMLLLCTQTPIRIGYAKNLRSWLLTHPIKSNSKLHQVLRYSSLLQPLLQQSQAQIIANTPSLKLIAHKDYHPYHKKIRIGINPGAAFGSAKRWLKEYFSETILYLIQKDYEVVLFGSQADVEPAQDMIKIVQKLVSHQEMLQNIIDLTGKTSISSLIDNINMLHLFITNDSGPMHIATALQIPLIAMFGPTDDQETSPWKHPKAVILNKKLDCAPCKKRVCPLKHHSCMKLITPDEVITQADKLLTRSA